MPLDNSNGSYTYLSISEGKIKVKVDGKFVFHPSVTGLLTGIEVKDDSYENKPYKKLCLIIEDGVDTFNLQMHLDSKYGRDFCRILPNIDFGVWMKLSPSMKIKDGKKEFSLFIRQNDVPLKHYFTKDNKHGLPDLKEVTISGKTMWDNSAQQTFFMNMLERAKVKLPPSILAGPATDIEERKPSAEELPDPISITEPVDDLPF